MPPPSTRISPTATGSLMRTIELGETPPALTDDLRQQVMGDLNAWKVQTIIVGPMRNQERMLAFFTWLTDRTPRQDGGVSIWRLNP